MSKNMLISLVFAFVVDILGLSGAVFAADQIQDAYVAFNQKVDPIEQQLYAKQTELDELKAQSQPDVSKVQQLLREIGELRGQFFAAESELRSQLGNRIPNAGMHHPGELPQSDYGMGNRSDYGYSEHRGSGYMEHGGGYHNGW